MAGWVYIISNKAMPGILKIGYTERTPYIRAWELYNTGCPYPYQVDYSIYVSKPYEVEQKAHELQRNTNVGKEWFSCSYNDAVTSIAQAITLTGSQIETNRIPPKPTQEQLSDVIKKNPDVASIIKQNQEKEYFSNIESNISSLSFFDKRKTIDEEKEKIRKEYLEKEKNLEKLFSVKIYEQLPVINIIISYFLGLAIIQYEGPSLTVSYILDAGWFGILLLLFPLIPGFLAYFFLVSAGIFLLGFIFVLLEKFTNEKFTNSVENFIQKILKFMFNLFTTKAAKKYYEECEKLNKEKDDILQKLDTLNR